jgi:regulator of protease activity HflC (stomatin/prohibitin superfamily)
MNGARGFILVVAAIAGFLLVSSLFTVDEREHAIKLRFNAVTDAGYDPGLTGRRRLSTES